MIRPLMLDLFCGAGGASKGYDEAGFDVVGVDHKPQPRYPYLFCQMDAMEALERLLAGKKLVFRQKDEARIIYLQSISAIHASPPCQAYSVATPDKSKHPDLIGPVRELLKKTGKPYVIENVPGAPLCGYITLCGLMFDLKVFRHRWFECNWRIQNMPHISHKGKAIGEGYFSVCGNSGGWTKWGKKKVRKGNIKECRDAMGIDWMTRKEIVQAVPPAYTKYIGTELMRIVCPGSV